ncbi:hypothetical protein J2T08_001157 [Neorhizobium galegae]|uniref:hypothetical protein n=1 Tax=Neorhizobium galegae TaxID=399 RepID=UPI00277E5740|nr:hypothetical protein [Neorhizobium galegae]MDQ0133256.1 hypothetical protein [Neorhizobium galegae]
MIILLENIQRREALEPCANLELQPHGIRRWQETAEYRQIPVRAIVLRLNFAINNPR